jgi:hypothetical protein
VARNSQDTAQVERSMQLTQLPPEDGKCVLSVKEIVAVIMMHVVIVVISGIAEPELFKSFCFRQVAS